ncbi:MAG: hypothetical protein ACR2RB_05020, partial [Gammaproteobacteria bacterium]
MMYVLWVAVTRPSLAVDGTVIGDVATAMSAGTWVELPTINADVVSASESILEFSDEMIWSGATRSAYFIGTSDPNGNDEDNKFIEYRAADNAWQVNPDPPFFGGVRHAYDHHAIDADNGRIYYRRGGSNNREFWEYDIQMRQWTEKAEVE